MSYLGNWSGSFFGAWFGAVIEPFRQIGIKLRSRITLLFKRRSDIA